MTMARADTSPKVRAIIKAAIRNKCHVIARRYPHQRLDTLHGSNVKWLVLSDELFHEVCSEFTIQKLEMGFAEKRALFDADWVPQVTYELITKPSRPRRRRSQQIDGRSLSQSMSIDEHPMMFSSPWRVDGAELSNYVSPIPVPTYQHPPPFKMEGMDFYARSRMPSTASTSSVRTSPTSSISLSDEMVLPRLVTAADEPATSTRPKWFETVLN